MTREFVELALCQNQLSTSEFGTEPTRTLPETVNCTAVPLSALNSAMSGGYVMRVCQEGMSVFVMRVVILLGRAAMS